MVVDQQTEHEGLQVIQSVPGPLVQTSQSSFHQQILPSSRKTSRWRFWQRFGSRVTRNPLQSQSKFGSEASQEVGQLKY